MKTKFKQRGISFVGLVFVGGIVAVLGVVMAEVFPTLTELNAIDKAVNRASAGTTVLEVRSIFDKASAIDDFKSITSKDLEISKQGDKVVVKYAYTREIHLAGPAYLTLKYSGQSK